MFTTNGCLTAGVGRASELRRQAMLIDDLMRRLATVVRELPRETQLDGWWGPARDRFIQAVERERTQLGREIYRLDSLRVQLEYAALNADTAVP